MQKQRHIQKKTTLANWTPRKKDRKRKKDGHQDRHQERKNTYQKKDKGPPLTERRNERKLKWRKIPKILHNIC